MKKSKTIPIEKYIASQTTFSRRAILALIQNQKITCNNSVVTSLKQLCRIHQDIIKVNGQTITHKIPFVYYKFNKPLNVISTLDDPKGRKNLSDFLVQVPHPVFPIGRLDRQTKGLLLFTNDGDFSNQLQHPRYQIEKKYKVTLDASLTKTTLQKLESGLILEDGPIRFSKLELLEKNSLLISIHEGRNRIIRRTFQHLGYTVKHLKRLAIGPILLSDLKEGHFKKLSRLEYRAIQSVLRIN